MLPSKLDGEQGPHLMLCIVGLIWYLDLLLQGVKLFRLHPEHAAGDRLIAELESALWPSQMLNSVL